MGKHIVRKSFFHKGYVFLLSVVETYALWSTHKTMDERQQPMHVYAFMFQESHDKQIDIAYQEMVERENKELENEGLLVDNKITESKKIIETL